MPRPLRAVMTLVIAISLTGCGAGQNAPTRLITQVTDGVELTVNDNGVKIKVVNLLLVATENGDAVVVGTIVNQGEIADELLGFSVGGNQAIYTGERVLKQNMPIRFEGQLANAKAVFPGVTPVAGRRVTLSLGFARAGFVTTEVIIRDKRDNYKDVTSTRETTSPDSPPLQ